MKRIILGLLVVVMAAPATGRTWRVEKDGSGDGTVIQDVVDMVASGDTILIGPGRFEEHGTFSTPGWTEEVCLFFDLPDLTIYDLKGREVKTLAKGMYSAGPHVLMWDGRDGRKRSVSSGLYLARFKARDVDQTQRMVLVR